MKSVSVVALLSTLSLAQGFSFVPTKSSSPWQSKSVVSSTRRTNSKSSLNMVDQQVILGGGIAFAGFVTGIGVLAFAENQGERAKERGSGLSERMSTSIAGGLLEDVEVSSVSDVASLTEQLEAALSKSSGEDVKKETELTEEEKKRIEEEADDGW